STDSVVNTGGAELAGLVAGADDAGTVLPLAVAVDSPLAAQAPSSATGASAATTVTTPRPMEERCLPRCKPSVCIGENVVRCIPGAAAGPKRAPAPRRPPVAGGGQ